MLKQDNSYFDSNLNDAYKDNNLIPKPFLARIIFPNNCSSDSDHVSNTEHLYVEQNDVVSIEELRDKRCFLARSDQQYGILAADSCQILDEYIPASLVNYLIDNQCFDLYVCFASFVAQDVGDLSITRGDIILATHQVNEHWLQGRVCFDSQANCWTKLISSQPVGTFPLNHCWRLDPERIKLFCYDKNKEQKQQKLQNNLLQTRPFISTTTATAHSSSLSSGSSSLHSSDYQQSQSKPPPRPLQLPKQMAQQAVEQLQRPSLLTVRQQDKLKSWLHTVKKKTSRLSTRITASLGLISLTRDEEFERIYDSFKHIEKTIRIFIKNLTIFVEHFENFLVALQNTSDNLSNFHNDKSHQKELEELRQKNKALTCEHFHAFKRTIDRQVIAVSNQLLQKFSGPQQLINKRSAKLLDYDNKAKEIESCRDLDKKASLRDQYVIAKDLYDRINRQLIEELPVVNQIALDIFRECVLVLIESRKNLILSYTKLTAGILGTPLMMSYTASDVVTSIMMSCDAVNNYQTKQSSDIKELLEHDRKDSGQTSGHGTRHGSTNDDDPSRPNSATSRLSSDFDQIALVPREISSTPLFNISETQPGEGAVKFDEPDGELTVYNLMRDNEHSKKPASIIDSDDGDKYLKKDNERRKRKFPIYIANWPFNSTGPNQLTITSKQPLKLIKGCDECGNADWSLVKDRKGQLGYVPSSYIRKKE